MNDALQKFWESKDGLQRLFRYPRHIYIIAKEYSKLPHEIASLSPKEIDGILAEMRIAQIEFEERRDEAEERAEVEAKRREVREKQKQRMSRGEHTG